MVDLDPELLRRLRCPLTRAPVVQVGEWVYATDQSRPVKYPIRDGVPVMIPSAAVTIDAAEFDRVVATFAQGQ